MNVTDILVNLILILIMLGVGTTITIPSFKRVFLYPKELITGLTLQMVGLPLLAFAVAEFSGLPGMLQAGIVILSACPGGVTSNFISYIVEAKTSLSVGLTSINTLLTFVTIPLFTSMALLRYVSVDKMVNVPFFDTMFTIFGIVLLPAIAGMLLRKYHSQLARKLHNPIKIVGVALMFILFLIQFLASQEYGGSGITVDIVLLVLPYVLLFHILSLSLGYLTSRMMKLDAMSSLTIGIEVGLQNTTLALLITTAVIGISELSYPALIYVLFSFFTTLGFGLGIKYLLKRQYIR